MIITTILRYSACLWNFVLPVLISSIKINELMKCFMILLAYFILYRQIPLQFQSERKILFVLNLFIEENNYEGNLFDQKA